MSEKSKFFYIGLLLDISDDGLFSPFWMLTFHGGKEFYCRTNLLPRGHMLKLEYYHSHEPLPEIRRVWDLGKPI